MLLLHKIKGLFMNFNFNLFHFAGIGSRKVTGRLSISMIKIGFSLAMSGGVLESGAADGSDTSFETGARMAYDFMCSMDSSLPAGDYGRVMNVHLGWKGFNGRASGSGYNTDIHPMAESLSSRFHPGWNYLSEPARKLMSRNAMQVLTKSLDSPVRFVMCYTGDGARITSETSGKTGGTGQAIRIANEYGVNVTNLGNKSDYEKAVSWSKNYFDRFKAINGIDLEKYVDEKIAEYTGFKNVYHSSFSEMINTGNLDIIVHDCNILHDNTDPISTSIFGLFPSARDADLLTRLGDKKKIGTFTESVVEHNNKEIIVINAYTQLGRSSDENVLMTDYEAVRNIFGEIEKRYKNKTIGIPRIGASVGQGCWFTTSNIVKSKIKNNELALLDAPSFLKAEAKLERSENKNNQIEMNL